MRCHPEVAKCAADVDKLKIAKSRFQWVQIWKRAKA